MLPSEIARQFKNQGKGFLLIHSRETRERGEREKSCFQAYELNATRANSLLPSPRARAVLLFVVFFSFAFLSSFNNVGDVQVFHNESTNCVYLLMCVYAHVRCAN